MALSLVSVLVVMSSPSYYASRLTTLHLTPDTLHLTPHTTHLTPHTLHLTPDMATM